MEKPALTDEQVSLMLSMVDSPTYAAGWCPGCGDWAGMEYTGVGWASCHNEAHGTLRCPDEFLRDLERVADLVGPQDAGGPL